MEDDSSYYLNALDPTTQTQLESGAFVSLCKHLSKLSDKVANIDMMSTAGFNRTTLAKWLVRQARLISPGEPKGKNLLDAYGHSQAARDVYGCDYHKWRKEFETKPTYRQMSKFHDTKDIHAVVADDQIIRKGMTTAMAERFEYLYKVKLQAGVFQEVCKHLRDRSDTVQDIDLKTVLGFDRTDLTLWLLMESRKVAAIVETMGTLELRDEEKLIVSNLDGLDFDKAAVVVYGCKREQWLAEHYKTPTPNQISAYNQSVSIHAKHDELIFQSRGSYLPDLDACDCQVKLPNKAENNQGTIEAKDQTNKSKELPQSKESPLRALYPDYRNLMHTKDTNRKSSSNGTGKHDPSKSLTPQRNLTRETRPILRSIASDESSRSHLSVETSFSSEGSNIHYGQSFLKNYVPPPPPSVDIDLNIGLLTINDNESKRLGPQIEQALYKNVSIVKKYQSENDNTTVHIGSLERGMILSDADSMYVEMKNQLLAWSDRSRGSSSCNLIFTIGCEGFGCNDLVPEITKELADREAHHLMNFANTKCDAFTPLGPLSRGIIGIKDSSIIVNLPENAKAAEMKLRVLFPLLLHAVVDLNNNIVV